MGQSFSYTGLRKQRRPSRPDEEVIIMRKYREEILGFIKVIGVVAALGLAEPIVTMLIR